MDVFAKELTSIPRRRINIGFIGAIHPNKGIFELLEAVKICREHQLDVGLVIAGDGNSGKKTFLDKFLKVIGISQDRNAELYGFIHSNQLSDYIHTLGFSTNTCSFFKYIDIICFPSYYNALGRPVFEAAFFRKPGIVAIKNPFPDTFIEGKTGLIVEEKNPTSIFNAIRTFYVQSELIGKMGDEAYQLATKNFDIEKNAKKLLDIYIKLLQ